MAPYAKIHGESGAEQRWELILNSFHISRRQPLIRVSNFAIILRRRSGSGRKLFNKFNVSIKFQFGDAIVVATIVVGIMTTNGEIPGTKVVGQTPPPVKQDTDGFLV